MSCAPDDPVRDLTPAEIRDYREHGVVHARGLFPEAWLARMELAVDRVLELYDPVPSSAYVIDPGGPIVFRSTWADSRKVEQVLDQLLEFERCGGTDVVSGGA